MFPSVDALVPNEHGLVGVGGDLAPKTLLEAYKKGIFLGRETPCTLVFSRSQTRSTSKRHQGTQVIEKVTQRMVP